MLSDESIEEICSELGRRASQWALKKAMYDQLSEQKKTLLAKLRLKSEYKTIQEREDDALTHSDYIEFKKGLDVARDQFFTAEIRYNNWKTKIDLVRSLESSERALGKAYNVN